MKEPMNPRQPAPNTHSSAILAQRSSAAPHANSLGRIRWLAAPFGAALAVVVGCPKAANVPPKANAGADQSVVAGATVTLDGSASVDPDGDELQFTWRQTAGAPIALSSASEAIVQFTAPPKGTRLAFELAVNDGTNEANADVNVAVNATDSSAQVNERLQRSVTDDPAFLGQFPPVFGIPDAGAGLPASPDGSEEEFKEFQERFRNARSPGAFEDELPPGESRTVSIAIGGPSGLAISARWIGTSDPLEVTLSLDGTVLATAKTHTMGSARGGAYANAPTDTGGLASAAIKNTSSETVRIRLVFITQQLPQELP